MIGGTKVENLDTAINEDFTPNYEDLPVVHRNIIQQSTHLNWDVSNPREFQIQSIHHGIFYNNLLVFISAKTGYDKSLIPLMIASICRRILVIEVPLLSFASDQVLKSLFTDKNIEVYHIDEHKLDDAWVLKERIKEITPHERDNLSIILFLSPQTLLPETSWAKFLKDPAVKDYISLLCIDEAHSVNL